MAAALGVWALLFIFDPLANPHSWRYYGDVLIPLLILEAWLWFEIRSGANWARIAQAAIVVIAGIAMIPALVELAQSERLLASIELVDMFLAVASLYLLFGPGRRWFGARRASIADTPDLVRPRAVVIAVALIAIAAAIPLGWWTWRLIEEGNPAIGGSVASRMMFRVAIPAMLCVKLLQGHRWARTVFIALALFGFLQVCYSVGVGYRTLGEDWRLMLRSLFVVSQVLPALLGLVATHLLYFSSGDWFRRRSLAAAP